MKWNLKNAQVTSVDVNSSAQDEDSFDFVSAEERGETMDEGHDKWIPILSVDQTGHRSADSVPTTTVSMNFEEIKVTYKEYDTSDVGEPVDNWLDLG